VKRELALRVLTVAVGLPPAMWLVLRGGLPLAVLAGAIAAVGTAEYQRIVTGRVAAAAVGVAFVLPILAPSTGAALWLLFALTAFGWVGELLRGEPAGAPERVGHLVAGVLFATAGMFALTTLRAAPSGREWAALAVAVSFANDAAAYLVGRKLGRHKLAPRVSPGKSWEGFAAGGLASAATVVVAGATVFPALDLRDQLLVAALASTVGPAGDLAKSLLKRSRGVKDSGRIFPGHGGVLDRVDALGWNSLALVAYVALR
jgi:phosphatidate cytidylyltransferase